MHHLFEPGFACSDIGLKSAEMLVANAHDSDALVVKVIRDLFRENPLEESWCKRVVDRRLAENFAQVAALARQDLPKIAFETGTHPKTRTRLEDGEIYGTLYLSFAT